MSLGRLTSADSVAKAIAEFDRLGREGFLSEYGFREAREYFLVQGQRLYDSKALAAVAYGYQFPMEGPLKAEAFSGGAKTVARVLTGLGYEVCRVERL